jgi:hypothetical protein
MSKEASAVNLINIGNGTAVELFDHELQKVLANIKDVNTDAKKTRSITLKVSLVPHGDRAGMQIVIDCNSKLSTVPAVQAGTMFIMKNKEGELQAYSHDVRQEQLFDNEEETKAPEAPTSQNVVSMTKQA